MKLRRVVLDTFADPAAFPSKVWTPLNYPQLTLDERTGIIWATPTLGIHCSHAASIEREPEQPAPTQPYQPQSPGKRR